MFFRIGVAFQAFLHAKAGLAQQFLDRHGPQKIKIQVDTLLKELVGVEWPLKA